MPSSRLTRRFEDILENIRAIESYTQGLDMAGFVSDAKTRDAVERCLERISEAAAKLGQTAVEEAPDQPWKQIRSLGNLMRHEYDRLRPERLWQIVKDDLQSLRVAVESALDRLRSEETS